MAITWGTPGSFPIDFGITEALWGDQSNPLQNQVNYPTGLIYDKTSDNLSGMNVNTPLTGPGGAYPQPNPTPQPVVQPTGAGAPAPQPTQTTQTGGIPGVDMKYYQGWTDQNAINADWANTWQQKTGQGGSGGVDPNTAIDAQINSSYDAYTKSLNDQMGGLGDQRTAQENIANTSYGSGINQQDLALTQGNQALAGQKTDLVTNQNKNLRGLSDNLRNMFMAGNVFLGARGAGDSSASNQYAYALNKVGTQARGDQMSQTSDLMGKINAQETNLKNVYDSNIKQLQGDRDNKIQQVAQWFSQQQQAIQSAVASGQLAKGQALTAHSEQILATAQNALQTIQTNAQTQYNSLLSWAESNSKTIGELKSNLSQAGQFAMTLPGAAQANGQISSDARGNLNSQPFFGLGNGSTTDKNKSIFPNNTYNYGG